MMPSPLKPYLAAFQFGFMDCFRDIREITVSLAIFGVLLWVYYHIFSIMPVHEFHVAGLTKEHLLWYFVMTETVIVGSPSLSAFGRLIGDGQFTGMMQRPTHPALFFLARQTGLHFAVSLMLLLTSIVLLPILVNAPFLLPWQNVPLFVLQLFIGVLLFEIFTYLIGTTELLGPYSKPFSWIIGKLIFVFGGLFLPVSYFPPLLQKIAFLTPFPATIFSPAIGMLPEGTAAMPYELGRQLIWLVILFLLTLYVNRRTISYVMERGGE